MGSARAVAWPFGLTCGQPFGYAGEQWDANTNLIYLRARWYNPSLGRFLTRDPVPGAPSLPATLNPYAYGRNNPALYVDPSGKFAFIPLLIVGLAGGALGGLGYYAIQSYMHADPCTGQMNWDWNQAAFWSGAGAVLGAAIGAGIYGGWWVGIQFGWWGTTAGGGIVAQQMAQRASAWGQAPFQRGVAIENQLGRSPQLTQNFPTIDRFVNGTATSIKSLDLSAPTYQDVSNLARTVQRYIDTMAAYQGQPTLWGNVAIQPGQITARAIDLVIPASGTSPAQLAMLQQMQRYAASAGVTLNIIKMP
jgi:RHS repeat-associated protein